MQHPHHLLLNGTTWPAPASSSPTHSGPNSSTHSPIALPLATQRRPRRCPHRRHRTTRAQHTLRCPTLAPPHMRILRQRHWRRMGSRPPRPCSRSNLGEETLQVRFRFRPPMNLNWTSATLGPNEIMTPKAVTQGCLIRPTQP